MNSKYKYELITSSKPEFELLSVNSKINIKFILIVIITAFVLFAASSYFNGVLGANFTYITMAFIMIIIVCIFTIVMLNNARSMKLVITDKGIALSPNKFVLGIPLHTFVAEEWQNILCYKIIKTNKLLRIGGKSNKIYHLYIRTDGVIPRCVNNYGVSVFCVTGHHMSDDEADRVSGILCKYSIKKCADDGMY